MGVERIRQLLAELSVEVEALASGQPDPTEASLGPLSPRRKQVARLLLEGHANIAIAKQLGLSLRTVKVHVAHIFKVYGVTRRQDLVRLRDNWVTGAAGELGQFGGRPALTASARDRRQDGAARA